MARKRIADTDRLDWLETAKFSLWEKIWMSPFELREAIDIAMRGKR